MTEREKVIKGLECCSTFDRYGFPLCEECPYADDGTCHELDQLHRDAFSLLKAQEPEPPRFAVAFDKIFYACDKCGKSLLVVIDAEGINSLDNMPKYCPECGQAVKWDG